MPALSVTIEQLARDTAQIDDPETALRALTALRQELDATERELVQRALAGGASWSHIARSLGVTKQAAHRKHRHLAGQPLRSANREPRMLVTGEARYSVQLAREEAVRLGQSAIGTEHILLGILRCSRTHAVKALNALGVSYEAASQCLQTTIPGAPAAAPRPVSATGEPAAGASRGATPPSPAPPGDSSSDQLTGVSAQARRIMEGSLREALQRGDEYIGVEHLLLALLADSRNGAVQTLEALKVTPAHVRRQLDHEWRVLTGAD